MDLKSSILFLGKIIREWGIRGQVRVASYNPESDLYLQLKTIYVETSEGLRLLDIEEVRRHGSSWIFKFSGYESPEASRELRGLQLGLPRSDLPALREGEYYLSDLIGKKVIGPQGKILGTIQRWNTVGETEVMVVKLPKGEERMVPFHENFLDLDALKVGKVVLKETAEELL